MPVVLAFVHCHYLEPHMSNTSPPETLGDSFRQSRRELFFILGTWVVFATWISVSGALTAFELPSGEVKTLLGMPRWVFISVALPWVAANGVIFYFALSFMKDTDLGGHGEPASSSPATHTDGGAA